MGTSRTCPQCGFVFEDGAEPELAGLCPRCLAGAAKPTTYAGSHHAATRIDVVGLPLRPGADFRGFAIEDVLGQGGMGVVYKARQTSLGRPVALKVLAPQLASSEAFSRRFEREAKILASLNHPNVVQVYDFGREGDILYLAMEYVDGESLEQRLARGRIEPAAVLGLMRQVALGLARVHEAGLVHRDLKPANVFIAKDGTAKLGDFGLAVETEAAQKLTESGCFIGTPHYVSPEHAQGRKVDGRSDLYALGVVLFEALAGRPPFQAPSTTALLLKHVNEPPPALHKLAPHAPKAAQELVRRLLAKNPAARPDSAATVARDLDRAVAELGQGPSPRVDRVLRAPSAPSTRPFPVKLAAAAVAAVAAAGALIALLFGGSPPAPAPPAKPPAPRVAKAPPPPPPASIDLVRTAAPPPPPPPPATEAASPPEPAPAAAAPADPFAPAVAEADRIFEAARAAFEEGKAAGRPGTLADASFKAEEARTKYRAVVELGQGELQKRAEEQLKAVQQFLKLVNEARLAMAAPAAPPATPAAPVPAPLSTAVPAPAPVPAPAGSPTPSPAAPARPAVPEAAALREAEKLVRTLFKAEYAKRGTADVRALAKTLLERSISVEPGDPTLYVMLRDARDLGAQTGDVDTALAAVDRMAMTFDVDPIGSKVAVLAKAGPAVRGPEAIARVAEAYAELLRDGIAAGDYDAVAPAVSRAEAAARASGSPTLIARVQSSGRDVAFLQKEKNALKGALKTLEAKPEDPAANHAVGRFTCLAAGDWARGLPMLARSGEAAWKAVAEKELARPEDPDGMAALGDAWWALLEKERAADYKKRIQARAAKWYVEAAPGVSGVAKLEIENRLRQTGTLLLPSRTRIARSETVGGRGGGDFEILGPNGTVLVGLRTAWSPGSPPVLRTLQPVFGDGASSRSGGAVGATGLESKEAVAKPGYAVGAVFARGASRVHGIKLVYMRIAGASLDPRDAYESEWLGERAPGDVKLGGDGNYVLGVFGGAADDVDRMGIVQLDRSAGGPAPAGPGRGGAVAPLPPGAIDLLAMVDPEKDALKGEWRFEGRSATVSGDMVLRLQMPYVFPDEYDFIVDVERLADHFLVLGLPFEQGGFNVAFDISGRTAVDVVDGIHADRPDNPSAVAGRAIEIRKPSRIVCAVRKSGLQVSVNGKTLLQWTDWSRVRPHPEWKVRDAGTAFVGCQHPFFRFNAVAVVPVRGVGRPLRSAPAPRGSVDLLALVDPARDAVKGSWTRTSRGLQSPPTVDNLLQVPYAAPDEYDLEAVVEWKDGPDGMGFGLVGGGRQVMLMIGSWHQARNGLRFVDDKMENEHEAAFPGAVFRKGKPVLFRFAVRKGTLEVLVDGRRAWLWKADWTRVSAGGFATPESEAFALCSLFGTYEVSRLTLMPVTGTGRPLR